MQIHGRGEPTLHAPENVQIRSRRALDDQAVQQDGWKRGVGNGVGTAFSCTPFAVLPGIFFLPSLGLFSVV
jgi:hypothetical protein